MRTFWEQQVVPDNSCTMNMLLLIGLWFSCGVAGLAVQQIGRVTASIRNIQMFFEGRTVDGLPGLDTEHDYEAIKAELYEMLQRYRVSW